MSPRHTEISRACAQQPVLVLLSPVLALWPFIVDDLLLCLIRLGHIKLWHLRSFVPACNRTIWMPSVLER